jgi:hypothetical protein
MIGHGSMQLGNGNEEGKKSLEERRGAQLLERFERCLKDEGRKQGQAAAVTQRSRLCPECCEALADPRASWIWRMHVMNWQIETPPLQASLRETQQRKVCRDCAHYYRRAPLLGGRSDDDIIPDRGSCQGSECWLAGEPMVTSEEERSIISQAK